MNDSINEVDDMVLVDQTCQLTFSLKRLITEEHKPTQIYCVRFCDIHPLYYSYLASVGSNCISVYNVTESLPSTSVSTSANDTGHGSSTTTGVRLIQGYLDEDSEEIFYACTWCSNSRSELLLVVAGFRGILKVINCLTYEIEGVLLGHGNAVNDLRVHPINNSLVFSVSKDESIRLWNVETNVCVAIFAGEQGHRDEILSIDPHPLGNCFVSAGMDTSIKIWGLDDPRVRSTIDLSFTNPSRSNNRSFLPVNVQTPLFSTTQVHSDYVDSVRWVGNCILSKSTKNRIALWAPDSDRYKGAPLVLREFVIVDSNLWFVRMDVCIIHDILAVGNKDGRVFVYNLSQDTGCEESFPQELSKPSSKSKRSKFNNGEANKETDPIQAVSEILEYDNPSRAAVILSHPKLRSTVRQVAFQIDGKYIAYSCDDGTIAIWNIHSRAAITEPTP